jgi:hypothetical protein
MRFGPNESTADRIIRIAFGVILAAAALAGVVAGTLAVAVWVVAAILVVTGVVGFCPLYALFRFSTRPAAH